MANLVSISRATLAMCRYSYIWRHQNLDSMLYQRPLVECGSAEVLRSSRYMYGSLTFSVAISKLKGFRTHTGDCWIPLRLSAISSRSLRSSQHGLLLVPFVRS